MVAAATKRRFTVLEFDRMVQTGILDADERIELLDGELVMNPPPNPPHATVTTLLSGLLHDAYRDEAVHIRCQQPLVCSTHDKPEPDVAVVRGRVTDFSKHHPRGADALLVVEVSETSIRSDRERKATLYAQAGVPVYWIIDLKRRRLEAFASRDRRKGRYRHRIDLGSRESVALPTLPTTRLVVARLLP